MENSNAKNGPYLMEYLKKTSMRDWNAIVLITWNMCPIRLNLSSGQLVYQKSKYPDKPNEL